MTNWVQLPQDPESKARRRAAEAARIAEDERQEREARTCHCGQPMNSCAACRRVEKWDEERAARSFMDWC